MKTHSFSFKCFSIQIQTLKKIKKSHSVIFGRSTRPEWLYFSSCRWLTSSRYKSPSILFIIKDEQQNVSIFFSRGLTIVIIGTASPPSPHASMSVKVRNNQSLTQPPVHTDIQRLQSNSNCSRMTVPKKHQRAKTANRSLLFTDACFFRSNEALRSNAEVGGQTNALAGEGYIWRLRRCVATPGELFWENELGDGAGVKMSAYQTERQRGGGG